MSTQWNLRVVEKDSSGYYYARWDRAVPVKVIADTREEAAARARALMGKCRNGWYWAILVDSVQEVAS